MKTRTVLLIVAGVLLVGVQVLFAIGYIIVNFSQQEMNPVEKRAAEVVEEHMAGMEARDWEMRLKADVPIYTEECVFAQLQGMDKLRLQEPIGVYVNSDDLTITGAGGAVVYYDNGERTVKWFRTKFRVTNRLFGKKKWETLECSIIPYGDRFKER